MRKCKFTFDDPPPFEGFTNRHLLERLLERGGNTRFAGTFTAGRMVAK
jgi:hypothetical protein